jgi:hypothetical protein
LRWPEATLEKLAFNFNLIELHAIFLASHYFKSLNIHEVLHSPQQLAAAYIIDHLIEQLN